MKTTNNVDIAEGLLSRLNFTKQNYVRLFEGLDKFYNPKDNLISSAELSFLLSQAYGIKDPREIYSLNAIVQWRTYKKIYNFDKDLLELIFDQRCMDSIMKISTDSDFFKKLPFNGLCMYDSMNDNIIIVSSEDHKNKKILLFHSIKRSDLKDYNSVDGMMSFTMYPVVLYENMTIEEALLKDFDNESKAKEFSDIYKRCISMLAYILSVNSDISKSSKTINTYRENTGAIKDKFREIEEMDVGIHIGAAVRMHKIKYNSSSEHSKNGSSKCPHVRSGHYHSFWTGKRDSDNRNLIVKWIPPMFINSDKSENVNINNVVL